MKQITAQSMSPSSMWMSLTFIDSKKIEDDEQMAYQTKRAIEEVGQPKKKKSRSI